MPQDIKAMRAVGSILVMLGKLPEARRVFQGMIEGGGAKEMMGRGNLADLDLAQGRYREARAHLQAGIAAAKKQDNQYQLWKQKIELATLEGRLEGDPPPHPVLLYLLGRFYANAHRSADAAKVLLRFDDLAKQQSSQLFRSMLEAEIALNERNTDRAVEAAEEATRNLNSTMALETLARAYAAAGRDPDALHTYEQVLARGCERANSFDDPGFHHLAEIHYRAGMLYRKTGDSANARKHLQAFLELAPQADPGLSIYAEARKALGR
jgi:tetratricopeptide (TPR) repeat protein